MSVVVLLLVHLFHDGYVLTLQIRTERALEESDAALEEVRAECSRWRARCEDDERAKGTESTVLRNLREEMGTLRSRLALRDQSVADSSTRVQELQQQLHDAVVAKDEALASSATSSQHAAASAAEEKRLRTRLQHETARADEDRARLEDRLLAAQQEHDTALAALQAQVADAQSRVATANEAVRCAEARADGAAVARRRSECSVQSERQQLVDEVSATRAKLVAEAASKRELQIARDGSAAEVERLQTRVAALEADATVAEAVSSAAAAVDSDARESEVYDAEEEQGEEEQHGEEEQEVEEEHAVEAGINDAAPLEEAPVVHVAVPPGADAGPPVVLSRRGNPSIPPPPPRSPRHHVRTLEQHTPEHAQRLGAVHPAAGPSTADTSSAPSTIGRVGDGQPLLTADLSASFDSEFHPDGADDGDADPPLFSDDAATELRGGDSMLRHDEGVTEVHADDDDDDDDDDVDAFWLEFVLDLLEGVVLKRHGLGAGPQHGMLWLDTSQDVLRLCWGGGAQDAAADATSSLRLDQVQVFKGDTASEGDHMFRFEAPSATFLLEAASDDERDRLADGTHTLLTSPELLNECLLTIQKHSTELR